MKLEKTTMFTITDGDATVRLTAEEAADLRLDLNAALGMPLQISPTEAPEARPGTVGAWMLAALSNRKIEAIKQVRANTGLGLKEAKDVVELFLARLASLERQLMDEAV